MIILQYCDVYVLNDHSSVLWYVYVLSDHSSVLWYVYVLSDHSSVLCIKFMFIK